MEKVINQCTTPSDQTHLIKEEALRIGFDLVGITQARTSEESNFFESWIKKGYFGEMAYLEKGLQKRKNPATILNKAKSIICCALNYYTLPKTVASPEMGQFSRYTWGRDYHQVMTHKLKELDQFIHTQIDPKSQTKIYADTGPILEKSFAQKAGLGWIGKNTCLINPRYGSWLFLGEILTDLELNIDLPISDQCGTCTQCLEACPTKALKEARVLDARNCISYLTLEHRGKIPVEKRTSLKNQVAGCDLCQEACPKNQKSIPTQTEDFLPIDFLNQRDPGSIPLQKLIQMDKHDFKKNFSETSLQRLNHERFERNIIIAIGNSGNKEFVDLLKKMRETVQTPELFEYIDESIKKLNHS